MSNLPIIKPTKFSDRDVVRFFDTFRDAPLEYSANQVDAVVSFFSKRGFDETAAISTATILLQQAKIDDVNVYKLLDTLEGLSEVELSKIVAEILNLNRPKSSSLGYKIKTTTQALENRNIERPLQKPDIAVTQDYAELGYVEEGYVRNISQTPGMAVTQDYAELGYVEEGYVRNISQI